MITKGIIEEVINFNKVKVRCPVFDKIHVADLSNNNLNIASVCNLPGSSILPRKGDVVFVGFENDNFSLPVVLGYLNLDSEINSSNSLKIDSLSVHNDTHLPRNTTIGQVYWNNIENISSLSSSVVESIDNIDSKLKADDESIKSLELFINDVSETLDRLTNDLDLSSNKIEAIKKLIGEFGNTDTSSLFGIVYNIISKLDYINEHLGVFSKENTLEDQLLTIDKLIYSISNYSSSSTPTFNDEPNCMLARAEKMITVSWKPIYTFNKWNSSDKFISGQSYIGMPYSLFGFGYKYESWKKHSNDNISISRSVPGYGQRTGPKYGSCCADFVSEVLGLPNHQRSCSGLINQTKYLDKLTGESAKASNIKSGDVLIATDKQHAMWVGNVNGDLLTIYEQNPPLAHKFNLSISKNSRNGFIYWGNEYGIVLRPNSSLLELDVNRDLDNSFNIENKWIYKGNKTYGSYSSQSLTDKEYMNNALVFWKLCKKAGWTAEAAAGAWSNAYAESSGNPWSYGTGGGGLFGFTPFDKGNTYRTGIYDYATYVLKDSNKRWDGDVQVGYVNWQIKNIIENKWTGIFTIRQPTSKYWNYTPPSNTNIPSNNFNLDTYIKLDKKTYGATPTICAKLWLARYGVVDKTYPGRDLNKTINNHTKKAEELYKLFIKY